MMFIHGTDFERIQYLYYSYCTVELSKWVKQNDQQILMDYICVLNVDYALACCFHTAEFDKLRCHFWGTDV